MDIQDAGYAPNDLNMIPYADQTSLSMYDNVSFLGSKPDRGRYKSIRLEGQERPQSVVIWNEQEIVLFFIDVAQHAHKYIFENLGIYTMFNEVYSNPNITINN